MLLRLVQARLAPDQTSAFRSFYEQEVIPALARSRGCRFACLALSSREPGRGLSLTFWNAPEDAVAYERSGLFAALLESSRRFFAESTPWDIRLSEDLRIEIASGADEPVVQSYLSTADDTRSDTEHWCDYLRIVSLRVLPDGAATFAAQYREHVLPELHRTTGCCSIHLAQSVADPQEFISCTIWRTKADADRYEREGTFRRLVNGLASTLSPMSRTASPGMITMTSDDVTVDAYAVAAAQAFGRRSA